MTTYEPIRCSAPGCGNAAVNGRVIYECDVCGADVCSDCSENCGPTGNGVQCVDGNHINEVRR